MNFFKQRASNKQTLNHDLTNKLVARGDRARDVGRWALAAASYSEALELDPNRDGIWVQNGHAFKELGSLARAEISYRRALSLNAKVGDSYLQLGHVLKLKGNIREAAENYLKALEVEPNLSAAREELVQLGFTSEAIDDSVKNGLLAGRPYLENRSTRAWETVAESLQRMRIERGWLYRTCIIGAGDEARCAMTFVPD